MLPEDIARPPDLGASPPAIRAHYDTRNDFFAKWLDPSLCYSAARWAGGDNSLAAAQARKLTWHLDAACVSPGAQLLDVGCGWGALLSAAANRGVAQATGITPSYEQAGWIGTRWTDARIRVVEDVWQRTSFDQPFDVIVSIGALEHFARRELPPDGKIRAYARCLKFCRENMAPGGHVSLQFLGWMDVPPEDESRHLPMVKFPESNLPCLEEVLSAGAKGFRLIRLENRPEDYARTLKAWLGRLHANRNALTESFDKVTVRTYIRGIQRFLLGFETGSIGLYRAAWKAKAPRRP